MQQGLLGEPEGIRIVVCTALQWHLVPERHAGGPDPRDISMPADIDLQRKTHHSSLTAW